MPLEQEDIKPFGPLLSKQDDGGGFPWNGTHEPYVTQEDLQDRQK